MAKMSVHRKLPKGRLERIAKLARMGAGTGIGLVTGRSAEALAEQATDILASMRGLAAKIGQMASTVEGILPESLEASFSSAMSRLRDNTDTSPFEEIAATVERELGDSPEKLFLEFDPTPMASASIGQVHRARLPSGLAVAVKVQHSGIERAMENDLSNVRLVERMAGTIVPKGLDVDRVFDEVAARFREELDYRIEAKHQIRLSRLHEATPGVKIPEVVTSHSSQRVITTELCAGRSFDEVLRDASPEERCGYATTLWRFVFRSILVGGEFNADPHPGNYLFADSPKVTFLDFGCVQRLSEGRRQAARRVHEAAVRRDESDFAVALRELLPTKGGAFEDFVRTHTRRAFEPIFASPFRMNAPYLRRLLVEARDAKFDLLRARDTVTAFPPELALMNRLQFGFYSLLARLDVELDYAALQREILAEA